MTKSLLVALTCGALGMLPATSARAQSKIAPSGKPQQPPSSQPVFPSGAIASPNATSQTSRATSKVNVLPAREAPTAAGERILPGNPVDEKSSLFPNIETRPIDLATALSLVDVRNPEFLLAQQRVVEAMALRQLAAAQFLPSINVGSNYDAHTGALQQSSGNILQVKRNALFVGAGANAVAAGTVNVPGIVWSANTSEALFGYLQSRTLVAQRQFASTATRNDIGLQVALAYLDLLEAEGRRSVAALVQTEAAELARLTAAYAKTGQGRQADANRAETELRDREAQIVEAEGQIMRASAELTRLLGLEASVRLHPTDNWVMPHALVPEQIPLRELLAIALTRRPEMGERQAAVQRALASLHGARLLPFSPTALVGFSAGTFGGGSNLVSQPIGSGTFARGEPRFGAFQDRSDFDVLAYWTLRNIGLGNRALIDGARARLSVADWERVEVLERVRMEVASAYDIAQARYAQIETSEQATSAARDSWTEDLTRIRAKEGLPLEAIDSLRLLARARYAHLSSILDYNRAQFSLYVAMGQPPACALIRDANAQDANSADGQLAPATLAPAELPTPGPEAR